MLKIIILILLIAMIISLTSGAFFLLKDKGKGDRTRKALQVRVTLASLLILTIAYGIMSGQLTLDAPWHRVELKQQIQQSHESQNQQQEPQLQQ